MDIIKVALGITFFSMAYNLMSCLPHSPAVPIEIATSLTPTIYIGNVEAETGELNSHAPAISILAPPLASH